MSASDMGQQLTADVMLRGAGGSYKDEQEKKLRANGPAKSDPMSKLGKED
jgi:hypothetical protein